MTTGEINAIENIWRGGQNAIGQTNDSVDAEPNRNGVVDTVEARETSRR